MHTEVSLSGLINPSHLKDPRLDAQRVALGRDFAGLGRPLLLPNLLVPRHVPCDLNRFVSHVENRFRALSNLMEFV